MTVEPNRPRWLDQRKAGGRVPRPRVAPGWGGGCPRESGSGGRRVARRGLARPEVGLSTGACVSIRVCQEIQGTTSGTLRDIQYPE